MKLITLTGTYERENGTTEAWVKSKLIAVLPKHPTDKEVDAYNRKIFHAAMMVGL